MKIFLAIIVVLVLAGFVFKDQLIVRLGGRAKSEQGSGKNKKASTGNSDILPEVDIKNQWDLPEELREISGLAYVDGDRFACVQDEKGSIFIFNTKTGTIEKEIKFGGVGDYEGLALKGKTAFVVTSDAVLFEIDLSNGKATQFKTLLNAKNNIEALCYDAANNRLLLAGKAKDDDYPGFKAIFAFDLNRKEMLKQPVFKISLDEKVFTRGRSKKNKGFMPSAMNIHPVNGDIYITDGPTSRLLVMSATGNLKHLYELGKAFEQPEGLTFSPAGKLFISNEGKKDPGNILEVEIK